MGVLLFGAEPGCWSLFFPPFLQYWGAVQFLELKICTNFPPEEIRRRHVREKGNELKCHSHSSPAITLASQCYDAEGVTHVSSQSPHHKWGFRSNWQVYRRNLLRAAQNKDHVQHKCSWPKSYPRLGAIWASAAAACSAPPHSFLSMFAQCLTHYFYFCLPSLFCLFEECQLVCAVPPLVIWCRPADQIPGLTWFCFDVAVFTCLLPDPSPVNIAFLLLPTPLCISIGF